MKSMWTIEMAAAKKQQKKKKRKECTHFTRERVKDLLYKLMAKRGIAIRSHCELYMPFNVLTIDSQVVFRVTRCTKVLVGCQLV